MSLLNTALSHVSGKLSICSLQPLPGLTVSGGFNLRYLFRLTVQAMMQLFRILAADKRGNVVARLKNGITVGNKYPTIPPN